MGVSGYYHRLRPRRSAGVYAASPFEGRKATVSPVLLRRRSGLKKGTRSGGGVGMRPVTVSRGVDKVVAQVSEPALSPISQSAERRHLPWILQRAAGWKHCDTGRFGDLRYLRGIRTIRRRAFPHFPRPGFLLRAKSVYGFLRPWRRKRCRAAGLIR
jgi:hypothetical protein